MYYLPNNSVVISYCFSCLGNVLAVILNNDVTGAQVEESANEVFRLEEWPQHIDKLLFTLLGVNEFFVLGNYLICFSESFFTILLAHLSRELLEIASVEVNHIFIGAYTFRHLSHMCRW